MCDILQHLTMQELRGFQFVIVLTEGKESAEIFSKAIMKFTEW